MKLVEKIFKKKIVRNVIILASGTAAAQIISVVLLPIITRLYGPEAYGLMGTFLSIMNILIPIAALTYPTAIVLPKRDEDAKSLVKVSIIIMFFTTLFILLILTFFYQQIAILLQAEKISLLLFMLPLAVISSGYMQILKQWVIRKNEFTLISKVTIYEPIITYGGMVVLGLYYPLVEILILFTALRNGLFAFLLFKVMKSSSKDIQMRLKNSLKLNFFETAKKYKDFPLYRSPQNLLNGLSQSLPVLLLASLFGPATAGFYSLGRTTLSIPINLISNSVGDVFYPRISQAGNNGERVCELLKKATFALILVGVIPFSVIIITGPWLFTFIFGTEWTVAGEYVRWIALWGFFLFINQPCVKALPTISAQGFYLIFTVLTLVFRSSALLVGFFFYKSDLVAVALFGIVSSILFVVFMIITFYKSNKFDELNLNM